MLSPFLVVRFVFLALLCHMSVVVLALAAWNVHATSSAGIAASGAAVLSTFNSCILLFCLAIAFTELLAPRVFVARVKYECLWVAFMGALELGATLGITIDGASFCQPNPNWQLCASSSVLVPAAWISAFLLVTYFFVLFITALYHARPYPAIWKMAVHSVPWFIEPEMKERPQSDHTPTPTSRIASTSPRLPPIRISLTPRHSSASSLTLAKTFTDDDSYKAKAYTDDGSHKAKAYTHDDSYQGKGYTDDDPFKPAQAYPDEHDEPADPSSRWSTSDDLEAARPPSHKPTDPAPRRVRRGVDHPFARTGSASTRSDASGASRRLPPLPLKVFTKGPPVSRYIEHIRDSQEIVRPGARALGRAAPPPLQLDPFPAQVDDHDLPIPLPRLSQWIRADKARGINVHTIPQITP